MAFKDGVQPVRELYGVMVYAGAVGGYFVTSGDYSEEARPYLIVPLATHLLVFSSLVPLC